MNTIKKQFDEMLSRGIIPVFEHELPNDEWLTVDISVNDKGVLFSFDSNSLPVSFDGEIEVINDNHYLLPFDDCFDNLDTYLEMISVNVMEGYLLPNNLFVMED